MLYQAMNSAQLLHICPSILYQAMNSTVVFQPPFYQLARDYPWFLVSVSYSR